MRACVMAMVLFAGTAFAADDKPVVREIPTKDLMVKPTRGGKATEPAIVTSAEDLAKSPVVGQSAEAIAKLIDFDKEKLLVFAWAGSGQDKVAVTDENKGGKTLLTVKYMPGLTRDLRPHVKLFVVPKTAEMAK